MRIIKTRGFTFASPKKYLEGYDENSFLLELTAQSYVVLHGDRVVKNKSDIPDEELEEFLREAYAAQNHRIG